MSSQYGNSREINMKEIPKFQFEVNNEQLTSVIKQLAFNLKTQDKAIQKMKKQLQTKTSQSQITQALVFINSFIQIDPTLSKLLKSKQGNKADLAANPINNSSSQLGRKINQISESVSILNNTLRNLDKKVSDLEYTSKSSLNQKVNMLQEQIDQNNTKISNETLRLDQKIQLLSAEFGDKVREVQTKTLWQINDCKLRLNSCINQQYVKDSVKEIQGKMITRMKEQAIKQGAIDPERIQKIQQQIAKNDKEFAAGLTQVNYRITTLKDATEKATLSKQQFNDEKIQIQKRFGHFNNNLSDVVRRIRDSELNIGEQKEKISSLNTFQETCSKQLLRMNEVLKNLKIGDDFQKMLQKIDPHKICELDNRVDDLTLENEKLNKYMDLLKREMDRVRSKNEFCNILTPNTGGSGEKMSKQEIQEIIHDYFVSNMFAKKIQNLQSQIIQVKAFPEMVNDINKKIARMQKQSDNHNLIYELRGLQEYVKKENLITNNRINQLEIMINDDKKKRPSSAGKGLGDSRMASSISYKKLTPVNCISCYTNTPERKSLIKRM